MRGIGADAVLATALILAGLYVFAETRTYPAPIVPGSPGPAFFPRLLGGALIALAALLLARSVRPAPPPRVERRASMRVAAAASLAVLFVLLLELGDTFVLLPLLVGSTMVLLGERRVGTIAAVALLFDAFVYVVFYRMFGVTLPARFF